MKKASRLKSFEFDIFKKMKNNFHYLFYVTNFISLNNYISIIYKNNIGLDKCFFYSPRQIQYDIEINKRLNFIDISFNINKNKTNIFRNYINYKKFNDSINIKLRNKNFHLYLPHIINTREKYLILNKKCKKYSFVDEGFPAYRKDFLFRKNKINKIKYYTLNKIAPLAISKKKYQSSYGNYPSSFFLL